MNHRRHPYLEVADHQMWYRAVTWVPPGGLDPVVDARFRIASSDRVATIGSCFAQHLSRHLVHSGFRYFVTEPAPPGMPEDDAAARQYGVFSARYGNVYTVAQANQLIQRAYGQLVPVDDAWVRDDGAFADPFRPSVEPSGFADVAALRADREVHLAAVRTMFECSDVLVFTLGLTEAWRSRLDGAVYPTAPGVHAGTFDPARHEFINFDVDAARADLDRFCETVHAINPKVRVLLTVSPVPLVATYEARHVLVSTVYSKSVLRVAAAAAMARFDFVDYFPSYEIVGTPNGVRNYYGDDLREVAEAGVSHVMRVFSEHYASASRSSSIDASSMVGAEPPRRGAELICDEDTINAAIEASRR